MFKCSHAVRTIPSKKSVKGMTLIETLISVFLLAIGVLGVMNLQVRSLQASNQTKSVSSATLLSEDLIERVRSNFDNRAQYVFDGDIETSCDDIPALGLGLVSEQDLEEWRHRVSCELSNASVAVNIDGENISIFLEWEPTADNTVSHTVTTSL